MKYVGDKKKQISFPLGGIGTGCIGLAGNGRFIDIEIFNRPNKGSDGGFTHFAIKAENAEKVIDARVLNTDLPPDYVGQLERPEFMGYGWGPDRSTMAGFPHFKEGEFEGEFPIAKLNFADSSFPGKVIMKAFNPFIPSNSYDSSIPAAFFEFEIENTTNEKLKYSLGFSGRNYYSQNHPLHQFISDKGMSYLVMSNLDEKESVNYGDITIATDCADVSYQQYWYRDNWFDSLVMYWRDFTSFGKLKNRVYDEKSEGMTYANDDVATLVSHVSIEPGKKEKVRFVLSWSNPYMSNTWSLSKMNLSEEEIRNIRNQKWKNYYSTIYKTSFESAKYAIEKFSDLFQQTLLFKNTLYTSTMPQEVIDAIGSNLSILKSPTCLRLSNGEFYGFEGAYTHRGCCEGTCTHVWSYAYSLAYLFPDLERSARYLEYTESMQENGGMGFRLLLPLKSGPINHRPAVDGQYGTVLRVYREYLLSGDKSWLSSIWGAVKQTIEYAWSPYNPDKWDEDKDGIMEGRQHYTLDMELFSANAWLSGMYLAGLRAGMELAKIMEDEDSLREYQEVFEKGVKKLNEELYNGEYFIQKIDLNDKSILEGYKEGMSAFAQDASSAYWYDEKKEIKYQIGEGCVIDQLLGQWHADLLGLGEIFKKEYVKSALKAIFKYNYLPNMYEHINPCRLYALNDEAGTVVCSYPDKVYKPFFSAPYSEEVMQGMEYEVASHMIKYGLEEEGVKCVKAVRDRYDGFKRNPWNEMECGSNYARSLSSYALLLVYSGFKCDVGKKLLEFDPIHKKKSKFLWSMDTAYGEVEYAKDVVRIKVNYGKINVKILDLNIKNVKHIMINQNNVSYDIINSKIVFEKEIHLLENDMISVTYEEI